MNKEDETAFCIFCNRYQPTFQTCKVDCFSQIETGIITKNEVGICDRCHQDAIKMNKLVVLDKVEGVEDLIYMINCQTRIEGKSNEE